MLGMARAAGAEYFSFVDDDDLVSDNYVDAIYPLLDGAHIVQFHMAFYRSGVLTHVEFANLICNGVYFDGVHHWRDIHHLHVTRLALACPFRHDKDDTSFLHSEDSRWADDMRLSRRLKTNHVVNDVLYHYFYIKDQRPDIGVGPFERVKMETGMVGTLPNGTYFDYAPGQTVIVHEPIARAWLKDGRATRVDKGFDFIFRDPAVLNRLRGSAVKLATVIGALLLFIK
jgi:hypothetical protein